MFIAQLTARSLLKQEDPGSNTVISNFYEQLTSNFERNDENDDDCEPKLETMKRERWILAI